jgi:hypothetical protein
MARTSRIYIEDVDGSFKRFIQKAPKEVRANLQDAVRKTAFGVGQRMRANAPVGPDAPHIRNDIDVQHGRGLSSKVGYFGGSDNSSDQAHIALYNEFKPNAQPFMRPAAEDEESSFRQLATAALKNAERSLSTSRLL